MRPHDAAYKRLFSLPDVVRDLDLPPDKGTRGQA